MKLSARRTGKSLYSIAAGVVLLLFSTLVGAQTPAATSTVPTLINFSGTLSDTSGKPLTDVIGVTFLLYKDSEGGAPLWMETQNVHPDKTGHYSVVLGSATSQGLPQDVFASGEARWLAVQVVGQEEQPRILLVAVPYALKAGDAETIGGLPPSAFVLASRTPGIRSNGNASISTATASAKTAARANPAVTGKGVVDFIPMWDTTNDIIDSLIFQKNSNVGIGTTAPAATLDVNGKGDVRDTLTLFPKGMDSTLVISGTTFKVDQTGKVNFVAGQKFPGTGTITAVTTALGSGLSGGGTSGTLNLSINSTVVPKLATANKFTNTNTVKVNSQLAALTLTNPGGDGLDISSGGIAGFFVGGGAGSYSENFTDSGGSAAAYGEEFGQTQQTYGVVGYSASTSGIGVYGQAVSPNVEGIGFAGQPIGVWGDTGVSGGTGVFASADDGYAIYAANNSNGTPTALFVNYEHLNASVEAIQAGGIYGHCIIDVSGNLGCTGTKSAVVPVDAGTRKVALYAVESPENWFEDFGSGQLSNGAVSITLEQTFRQTVNTDTNYHVFLTPNGDSRGLYVAQKTAASFEVREQGGGTSSIAFDYRIVARRKGYEEIRLADKTKEMNAPHPKRAEGRRAVLPTELDKHHTPEAYLQLAKPVENTR